MQEVEYDVTLRDSPSNAVASGTALMCIIALLDRLDGIELLELQRHQLPRVMAQNGRPVLKVVPSVG